MHVYPTAAAKRAEAKKSAPKKTAPSAEEKKGEWWSMCVPPIIIHVLYIINQHRHCLYIAAADAKKAEIQAKKDADAKKAAEAAAAKKEEAGMSFFVVSKQHFYLLYWSTRLHSIIMYAELDVYSQGRWGKEGCRWC